MGMTLGIVLLTIPSVCYYKRFLNLTIYHLYLEIILVITIAYNLYYIVIYFYFAYDL